MNYFLGATADAKAPQVRVELVSESGVAYALTALIDTGADITCVSEEVVKRTATVPVTQVNIISASGSNPRGVYALKLRFPDTDPPHVARVEVAALPELGQDGRPDMLLGRDVLEQGSFCWHGDGRTDLSFGGGAR